MCGMNGQAIKLSAQFHFQFNLSLASIVRIDDADANAVAADASGCPFLSVNNKY